MKLKNGLLSLTLIFAVGALSSCDQHPLTVANNPTKPSTQPRLTEPSDADNYRWLETLKSTEVDAWVAKQNSRTLSLLTQDKRFESIKTEIKKIALAKDRLVMPGLRSGWIYNFWQDETHRKGIWRRMSPDSYKAGKTQDANWETLLDIDKLAKTEGKNWVWKGASCLPHTAELCLVSLSDAGEDAIEIREFNMSLKTFVEDGFHLPRARTDVTWMDRDHVFVGTDFGPNSLTASGYPRLVKLWTRGTPLSSAQTLFEGKTTDLSVGASAEVHSALGGEPTRFYIGQALTFYSSKNYLLENNQLHPIPFPDSAKFQGSFDGNFFAILRDEWTAGSHHFGAGSLVSLPVNRIAEAHPENFVNVVFQPTARQSIDSLTTTQSALYLGILDNVNGKLLRLEQTKGHTWKASPLSVGDHGEVAIIGADPDSDDLWLTYTDFLNPTSIKVYEGDSEQLHTLKSSPARFDATGMEVDQWEATSKDGTKIPYFIARKAGQPLNGQAPTILYGYGGFENSMTPYYLSSIGKVWLEQGGVYVLANIRGGGEFGPAWHQAAVGVNRQKAYDDFIAVAEDLIKKRVTSPRRLGIWGGSNGGLLVGAVMVQRPELFHAVLCQNPLLDMIRYRDFPPGASWTGEYGDPSDPTFRNAIMKYSPYQNVSPSKSYPKALFVTSIKDDRVHPSHARKMAAKMDGYGQDVLFYESSAGGHATPADIDQTVKDSAMNFTYFFQFLVD